jgi:23S rRNA (uridine2552-2'-O)-methyltransferase
VKEIKDHYYRKAKAEGYAARSVYKLEELDGKFGLIKRGASILDLGCAPGSWLQYASTRVGGGGTVVGIDIVPVRIAVPSNAVVLQKDVVHLDAAGLVSEYGEFDAVLSDMAPKTTGIRLADQMASLELARAAQTIALKVLRSGGHFACKLFESPEVPRFKGQLSKEFASVRIFRPKASRSESFELFLVCRNRRI